MYHINFIGINQIIIISVIICIGLTIMLHNDSDSGDEHNSSDSGDQNNNGSDQPPVQPPVVPVRLWLRIRDRIKKMGSSKKCRTYKRTIHTMLALGYPSNDYVMIYGQLRINCIGADRQKIIDDMPTILQSSLGEFDEKTNQNQNK